MSRKVGRSPNTSVQISTPGCLPVVGRVKTASQGPSAVLIVTSLSVTASAAAGVAPAVTVRPAATDKAVKSRRDTFSKSLSMPFPPQKDGKSLTHQAGAIQIGEGIHGKVLWSRQCSGHRILSMNRAWRGVRKGLGFLA